MDILPVFCDLDDFSQVFEPYWQQHLLVCQQPKRHRPTTLCLSEVMTIVVLFHASGYRTFKDYYTRHVLQHLRWAFPKLVSYNRFVELEQAALLPLCCYLQTRKGQSSGISFVDSTPIAVCHNRRIRSHKVFARMARRGRNSVDWFYGFKLHLVINDQGELLAFKLTAGNVDDRVPVPEMVKQLSGKLFGDKGYISQKLLDLLFEQDLHLVTKIKATMKNKLMPLFDKILLRKRAVIESVSDQLKNISQIEHTRHRSPANFLVNLIAGLIAYTYREKKPSLDIRLKELVHLPALVF
jgi:Transposase DDE domain